MKKLVIISIMAFSALLLVGCGKKAVTVTTDDTTAIQAQEAVKDKTPATKDQCMDLMAFAFKVAQLQAQGDTAAMTAFAQKANDLEIVYNNDKIEYEQTCANYLANDVSFMQKVQKLVEGLK